MDIENYFISNAWEGTEKMSSICEFLNSQVKQYIDTSRPLLDGEINTYYSLIKDKQLPLNMSEANEVLKEFSKFFQRSIIWQHPGAMINITPPANLVGIAAAFYTALFNPNFAQDESSGYLMSTELIVSKYLSELVDWNWEKSLGIFTFGGKGTNLYAVKIGLLKAVTDIIQNGIGSERVVVISSEKAHPCHSEVCDWLGLGKKACLHVPVVPNGQVDVKEMEKSICENIEMGNKIACIILNGGTTNEIIVDPIKDVVEMRDRLVNKYNLNYIPHIHVDAVIGWAWLFFKFYDFERNPMQMSKPELIKIKSMVDKVKQITYADSYGADFHKTGFCPYISSIFMVRDSKYLRALGNKKDKDIKSMNFGEYSPFEYSLELTRSSIGPVSAYVTLETFGVSGFQKLIYNIFSNGEYIRNVLQKTTEFDVINLDTEGFATLFVAIPPKMNARYDDIVKFSSDELDKFVEYNQQFYLYILKALEEHVINFKITFSKSYTPYGSNRVTGALKIYQMSPIALKDDLKIYLQQMITLKNRFDKLEISLSDCIDRPQDFVYRNDDRSN